MWTEESGHSENEAAEERSYDDEGEKRNIVNRHDVTCARMPVNAAGQTSPGAVFGVAAEV